MVHWLRLPLQGAQILSLDQKNKKKENSSINVATGFSFNEHQMWKTMKLDEFYVTEYG